MSMLTDSMFFFFLKASLSQLQYEVKVLEDSLQDLAWVMLQVKTRREDWKRELLESRGLLKRCHRCDSARVGHIEQ